MEEQIDWRSVRRHFPVVQQRTYLNTGTFGPLPREAVSAMQSVSHYELEEGRSSDPYFQRVDELRTTIAGKLADAIGATENDIVLSSATTHGCQVIVSGLQLSAGDEVVSTDLEHHSFTTVLRSSGAEVKLASVSDAQTDDELIEIIKAQITPRTRVIAVSHVSWIDGRVLPVAQISSLGPPVLVDGAQSVGAIPVDVTELGCQFIVFPCQKWLLGPDATGGIYIHPSWQERLHIGMPSYYGHKPYKGDLIDTPLEGAAKFSPGSISLSSLEALDASLTLASGCGVARFARAHELNQHFHTALSRDFNVVTSPDQSTLISFDPGRNADTAAAELAAKNVIIRTVAPANWIRVSVGFWNNEQDCDALIDALD